MTDYELELDALLADEAWELDVRTVVPPVLEDEAKAEQWAWAICSLQRQQRQVRQTAEVRRAVIDEWEQRRVQVLVDRAAWLERSLLGWIEALNRANPKVKTKSLPSGTLRVRPLQPTVVRHDETDATLDVLADISPAFVKVDRKPVPGELKKATVAGELLDPGETVVPDGFELRAAMLEVRPAEVDDTGKVVADAELVALPGVARLVPLERTKSITFQPAKSVTTPEHDAHPNPENGGHDGHAQEA